MRLIDTHCHLADKRLRGDLPGVLSRAEDAGVVAFVCAAGDLPEARAALETARAHRDSKIFCTVGIHPHDARKAPRDYLRQVESRAGEVENVAVGEIGLDYYRDLSPRDVQKKVFAEQLALAVRAGKPVVVHSRDAFDDTMAVLAESDVAPSRVLLHSCTENAANIRRALDYGATVSFSGIVTYRKTDFLREAAKLVPPDRLLIETDCPYLSPEPVRKMRTNEPANVVHVLRMLADVRGVDAESLAERTTANAADFFGLDI
ncbi:MAG: TatD family hydrolase [Planctomycetota bacterium]